MPTTYVYTYAEDEFYQPNFVTYVLIGNTWCAVAWFIVEQDAVEFAKKLVEQAQYIPQYVAVDIVPLRKGTLWWKHPNVYGNLPAYYGVRPTGLCIPALP